MKTPFYYLLLTLLLVSCAENYKANPEAGSDPIEETDFFVFDLESNFTTTPKETKLNELIDSIFYIPLETHEKALLPAHRYEFAKIGNDMFIDGGILFGQSTPIYQFDSLGRFVKQVTYHGRGPNEILRTWGWYANANLKQINVISTGSYMVVTSTDSGERSTVALNERQGTDKIPLNDTTFVSAQLLLYTDIPKSYLYFTDRTGNLVRSIERNDELSNYNINTSESGQAPPYENYRLWSNYDGDAIFNDIFNDTLYRIKSHKEITPHLVFKRGALSPDPEDTYKQEKKKKQIYFGNIMESGDYVFLNYHHGDKIWSDVWSKRDGSLIIHTILEKGYVFNIFLPYELPDGTVIEIQVVYADKENAYCVMEALDACKFLPDVKEDDNPVIVVAKLRK